MKKFVVIFFLFLFKLNIYGQCGYLDKIRGIIKNKVCNNVSFEKSELQDLVYKMAVNCPSEATEFNNWYGNLKNEQEFKNYFGCGNASSTNQSNQSSSSCSVPSQPSVKQNTIINQYKSNPIAYSNNQNGNKFSNIKDEDVKKLENLETTNVSDFDESKINEILDIKEENNKVAQEAYHIASRGQSPFFNVVVFSGYKAKFNGVLDIDVSIDENGKLTSVSVASSPKDEELNRFVTDYIFDKYSKNREWSPAVGTNGRYISSNLNYTENFHKIIETSKVEQKQKSVENIKIDNQESENNQSYYQKFIAFKNGLINKLQNNNSHITNETALDNARNITEQMDTDVQERFLELLRNPRTSLSEIREYIRENIESVRANTRIIMADSLREFEEKLTEIDKK